MEKQLKKFLLSCESKEIPYFPIIFGIGEDERNMSKFVVALHDVYYSFDNFIDAMDAAFKCFVFYRINYPPQVKRFWTLINALFYKIVNDQLQIKSSLASVISSLRTAEENEN